MTERGLSVGDGAPACPFVAFEDDRDERAPRPDHRHRCYAEIRPAPRALAHQEVYCLATTFPACPTFQDWARREAARERVIPEPADGGERPRDPFAPRRPTSRAWAAPPPWLEGEDDPGAGAASDGRPGVAERSRATGRGLADLDPDRPWQPIHRPEGESERFPDEPRAGRQWGHADRLEVGDAGLAPTDAGDEEDDEDAAYRPRHERRREDAASGGLLRGLTGGLGAAIGRDSRPRVGDTRARGGDSPGSAGGELRSGVGLRAASDARPGRDVPDRSRTLPRDASAPAWERPRRWEAYPTLKTRVGLPSVPRLGIAFAGLLIAAAVLFVAPFLLRGSGGTGETSEPTPTASPVASPSAAPTPTPGVSAKTYVVKEGDNLLKIAKRFGIGLDELLAANPQIQDPDKIALGDEIVIPSPAPSEVSDGTVGASPAGSPGASP
ncbi:MAG TPA: LysM peptidoglycan-binding domain-containing protein [Candidatus Limnocylindrales bacterium]